MRRHQPWLRRRIQEQERARAQAEALGLPVPRPYLTDAEMGDLRARLEAKRRAQELKDSKPPF